MWENIRHLESQLNSDSLGFNLYIALQDQQESFSFNLYYHLSFDMRKYPALVYIDLKSDSARAGDLKRYIDYASKDFSVESLKKFKDSVEKGEIEPFYFSGSIPKSKNGFTGKGS